MGLRTGTGSYRPEERGRSFVGLKAGVSACTLQDLVDHSIEPGSITPGDGGRS